MSAMEPEPDNPESPARQNPPHKGTVVVVEDNAMNMRLLDQILFLGGYTAVTSTDGDGLVEIIIEAKPVVVLMDIQLPKVSGVDLMHMLKHDSRTKTVPVVAVTAFADPDSVKGFLAEGFDRVLTKPVSVKDVLAELDALTAAAIPRS